MEIIDIIEKYYESIFLNKDDINKFISETSHKNDKVTFIDKNNINKSILPESKGFLLIGEDIENIKSESSFNRQIRYLYDNLEENGVAIIRLINFDKLINEGELNLPIIEMEVDNEKIFLEKKYVYYSEEEKIIIEYEIRDTENKVIKNNKRELNYLMKRQSLEFLFKNLGFKDIEYYSSFRKDEYLEDMSKYLIIRAVKKEELLKDSYDYEEYDQNIYVDKKSNCAKGNCSNCIKVNSTECCKNKNNIILIKKN